MSKRQFPTLTGFLTSKSSNPTVNDTVEFQGYDAIGVGESEWQHNGITGQTPSQSPAQLGDGLLNDGNGNQWSIIGKALFTEQLGGVLDGATDNSLVITACKKWSTDTGGNVYLGIGTMMSGQILVTTGETFRLIGLNRELSIHKIISGTNSNNIQLTGDGTAKAYLKNLTLDGDMDNQTGGGHGIRSAGCLQLELDNVLITNALNYGIGLQAGTSKGLKWTNLEIRRCGSDGIDVKDYNLDNGLIYINGFLCSGHGETNTDSPALDVRGEVNASNITVNITGANVGVRYRDENVQGRSGFGVMSNVNVNGDGVSACVAAKFETSSKMASINGLTVNGAAIAVIQSATGVGGIVTGLQGNDMYTNDAIEISGSDMSITGAIETTGRVIDINSTAKRASIDINANRDSATAETIRLQAGATDCTIKGFIVDGTLNDSGTGTDVTNLRLVSA